MSRIAHLRAFRLLAAVRLAILAAGLALTTLAPGQVLRWAGQGDLLTLDPHSQNEQLTNAINGQVYDTLVSRDSELRIVPALATDWVQVSPTLWRMKLRQGVKFHDGSALTADDVVFSIARAASPESPFRSFALAMGKPRKIDDLTVEFELDEFSPVFLENAATIFIMSKAWTERHGAAAPTDFGKDRVSFTGLHANGTGPFMVVAREIGSKTVFRRNPAYWGPVEGNLREVTYLPIENAATRTAALLSGEVDLLVDPPLQDLPRLRGTSGVKVLTRPGNMVIFIGLDQARDELLYSSVAGRNPFKDSRVRRAMYQSIDIDAITSRIMRGLAAPAAVVLPSAVGEEPMFHRLPFDLAAARQLLADAGYAHGFSVRFDCPNNRYLNDQQVCEALAAMWAKIGLRVDVLAQSKSTYFAKLGRGDVSMYLLGWSSSVADPQSTLGPVLHSRNKSGAGFFNVGGYKDAELDRLIEASSRETSPAVRGQLIQAALREHTDQVFHIPLYRQGIAWAMLAKVRLVQRPDNWFDWRTVVITDR